MTDLDTLVGAGATIFAIGGALGYLVCEIFNRMNKPDANGSRGSSVTLDSDVRDVFIRYFNRAEDAPVHEPEQYSVMLRWGRPTIGLQEHEVPLLKEHLCALAGEPIYEPKTDPNGGWPTKQFPQVYLAGGVAMILYGANKPFELRGQKDSVQTVQVILKNHLGIKPMHKKQDIEVPAELEDVKYFLG